MKENGKQEEVKYKFPNGKSIEFYNEGLEDFLQITVLPIWDFATLMEDSETDEIRMMARILDDLCEIASQKLENRVKFITEKLGNISIDIARPEQVGIAPGDFLGLTIEPKRN